MVSALLLSTALLVAPAHAQERAWEDIGDGSIKGLGDLADLPEGLQGPLLDGRIHHRPMIINGTDTDSYKEVVAFGLVYNGYIYGTFCSASRLSNKWMLTAAHCVVDVSDYTAKGYDLYVFVGGDVANGDVLDYAEWDSYVSHPDYDDRTIENDIGLVKTKTNLNTYGNPVVVNDESIRRADYEGTEMLLVGFGKQSDATNEYGGEKQYAYVDYYSHDSDLIYTYESRSNACNGDSGGPLFELVDEGVGREVAGIVSFGTSTCTGTGTYYTRVDNYIDWIENYVVDLQTDHGEDTEEPPVDTEDTEEPPVDTEDTEDPPVDTEDGNNDDEDVLPSEAWDFGVPAEPTDGSYGRCAAVPGSALWLGFALLPLIGRRRR